MTIEARFTLSTEGCDWCRVVVKQRNRIQTIDLFVPLAEKAYPDLSTEEAVRQVAIDRFKQNQR